ncbi:MAG TPA: vitamin K epoxide reductase family protein [Nitrososphaerales archaeon]|nr:vitamin K epoxide reductase family protein [Nitrososphaerales archaeon]
MDRLSKAFVALSVIGLVIAVYHGYDEVTAYTGPGSNACSVFTNFNPFLSCTSVFASGYATLPPHANGLPLYILGLVWFPLIILLGAWFGVKKGSLDAEIMVPLLMVGNVFTLYLWYVELGVVHALCPICLGMYLVNYAMTGLALKALMRPV